MLKRYLSSIPASSNESVSNASLPPSTGRWSIPLSTYDSFLKKYAECVDSGEKMHMTELHSEYAPIIIDIDFKFSIDTGLERCYTHDFLVEFITVYNEIIESYFQLDDIMLTSYIFEKPNPVKDNGYIKDGIHIMYPYIVSKPDVQYDIGNLVLQKCIERKIFKNINHINKLEDVIDEAVIKKSGWFMYSSSKENREPYKLTVILNKNCEEMLIPKMSTFEKVKAFSIRKSEEQSTRIKLEMSNRKEIQPQQFIKQSGSIDDLNSLDNNEASIAENLVNILDKSRADDRSTW